MIYDKNLFSRPPRQNGIFGPETQCGIGFYVSEAPEASAFETFFQKWHQKKNFILIEKFLSHERAIKWKYFFIPIFVYVVGQCRGLCPKTVINRCKSIIYPRPRPLTTR